MRIVGHGIDIVSVTRISQILRDHGEHFLQRCFTPDEREYAAPHRRAAEKLAARFAAKEAALKALGTGLAGGISWTEIAVVRLPTGQPTLVLAGHAAQIAEARRIDEWWVSLSHTHGHAVASVIAVSNRAEALAQSAE